MVTEIQIEEIYDFQTQTYGFIVSAQHQESTQVSLILAEADQQIEQYFDLPYKLT